MKDAYQFLTKVKKAVPRFIAINTISTALSYLRILNTSVQKLYTRKMMIRIHLVQLTYFPQAVTIRNQIFHINQKNKKQFNARQKRRISQKVLCARLLLIVHSKI